MTSVTAFPHPFSGKSERDHRIAGLTTEIKRFATHDGPGIRTTVFVKGCPLRCTWCSNPETWNPYPELYFKAKRCQECGECVKVCPENAVSMDKDKKIDRKKCTLCIRCVEVCKHGALEKIGSEVTPEEIAQKIGEDSPFYIRSNGGLTVSGGEPLYQPEFTLRLFELCHQRNISNVLDTGGYAKSEDVKLVIKHVDLVLLDIKHMDPVKHKEWTGVSNELILKNAKLMASECEVRISLPLIPGVNDSEENVRKTAELASSLGIKYIDVMPFHRLGESKYQFLGRESPFPNFRNTSDVKMNEVIKVIESYSLRATKGRSM